MVVEFLRMLVNFQCSELVEGLKKDVVDGGKSKGFRVQGTVGGDIWYKPGEAGREAVMTEVESLDDYYGSPGELRKINEPRVERECRLYMRCTLIFGKYFYCDVASRNVIGRCLK